MNAEYASYRSSIAKLVNLQGSAEEVFLQGNVVPANYAALFGFLPNLDNFILNVNQQLINHLQPGVPPIFKKLLTVANILNRFAFSRIVHVAVRPDQDEYDQVYHNGQRWAHSYFNFDSIVVRDTIQNVLD